jgi:bacterial/archaeal transporter family protein
MSSAAPASDHAAPRFPAWLWLSLLTTILWGAWGIQSKLIMEEMTPLANQIVFVVGLVPPVVWCLVAQPRIAATLSRERRSGALYAFLTGILGGVGNIAFFVALAKGGPASIVVPLTSLFPLVTVLLAAVWLRERIGRAQIVGLGFALVAIVLLSL